MSESPMVDVTIDGVKLSVPAGTLVIRAAEKAGIRIPRFCDHPLLEPVAACRQCLVEVGMPDRNTGEIRFMPKPQPSCAQAVTPGMVVKTQETSEVAERAQHGVMEFLLINHPLDCPICDKGGECPLQNQAMSDGRATSRFVDVKRTYRKPLRLTSHILLDRDRCILCQRCVRFGKEIAGDPFIDLQGRGGGTAPNEHHHFMGEQIGTFDTAVLGYHDPEAGGNDSAGICGPYGQEGIIGSHNAGPLADTDTDMSGRAFASYFSGNIVQICPVGALTAASYRFRSRPFDLHSTPSVTEHDASGSAIRVDVRRGQVVRRMAGNEPLVNEEWITDKDRFAFEWTGVERLTTPLVRQDGRLVATSWSHALDRVRAGLLEAGQDGTIGFLPGGHLPFEDAWAWSKFARTVVGSDSIDMRARETSEEERSFLASVVAGSGLGVTYEDVEKASQVLLVALEPEDECGALFLRMHKSTRKGRLKVATVAPMTTNGSRKLGATVLHAAPGTEVEVVASIAAGAQNAALAESLANGVVLVGERAGRTPGLLSAVLALAQRTGARLQWVPRRVGERGGIEAGLLPGLLPFGRPQGEAGASLGWGDLPTERGLDVEGMLAGAADGSVSALVVGGVDVRDLPDTEKALVALSRVSFLVSLEVTRSPVTDLADVVLPVAPQLEKHGTWINWEGRLRPFGQAISATSLTDRDVLARLAREFGADLGGATLEALYDEVNAVMTWSGSKAPFEAVTAPAPTGVAAGQALLATHKPMLDSGRLQSGADWLAGSARRPVALVSAATLAGLGLRPALAGPQLTVSTERGAITLPVHVADLPDAVVWVPECSPESFVHVSLGASGSVVTLSASGEVAR
ncbi:NADH-quinone oxidoreductase subunit G [Schaalia sp. 19OD2882]|uniref:NADH-quinone oxidoreductase subunit G n=1 Tax=Schaalia sp. 19OD2882 TaxID=2794089 RepID=UPI001C1E9DFA|nr:NADH-quinone oxidoreductase subunit G [Schaalia sp. 19OD2882]QWW19882.1 NADH-quinone oxidoreductase subunit G [Schaalia sp. 19OD2882]